MELKLVTSNDSDSTTAFIVVVFLRERARAGELVGRGRERRENLEPTLAEWGAWGAGGRPHVGLHLTTRDHDLS